MTIEVWMIFETYILILLKNKINQLLKVINTQLSAIVFE